MIVADERVQITTAKPGLPVLSMRFDNPECPTDVGIALAGLAQDWTKPAKPQYTFLSTALEAPHARMSHPIRELIERVTGMATITGREVTAPPVDQSIMETIQGAHLVIADLSGEDGAAFNLDVCIEVGMARASGVSYEVFARGPQRRPPFMLGRPQLQGYANEVELLGKLHRVVRDYRRRLIDAEIPA